MSAGRQSWEEFIRPVTIISSDRLSRRVGLEVVLASETFQRTGSFKFRAAYHTAWRVPQDMILTASSGNFGQAMALSCRMLRKRCLVVMPEQSAAVKIQAVRDWGGEVDLIDVTSVSRLERVKQLAGRYPEAYVASAYDDPLVIAGNATLGRELAKIASAWDVVLVPVGGGGLSAGVVQGLRGAGCAAPVVAVEPALADDAARSFREGRLISLEAEPATLADGARTLSLGQHNWAILEKGLADILVVAEHHIAEAVRLLFLWANLKAEPTGALTVAALLAHPERFAGRRVCAVVSGGNVDPSVYRALLENCVESEPQK